MAFSRIWRRLLAVFVLWSMPVMATPITYSVSGLGSGCLGGQCFGGASFVASGLADTEDLVQIDYGLFICPLMRFRIDVLGVGAGDSLNLFYFFTNNPLSVGGFLDELVGDVLDVDGRVFSAFDGSGAQPPTAVSLDFFAPFMTTAGELSFVDVQSLSFSAEMKSVSSPSSFLLLVCALIVGCLVKFRGAEM